MKIAGKSHVYATLPPFLNNRQLPEAERIILDLTVATMPEQDAYQREAMLIRNEYALDKAQELIEEKTRALVEKHFAGCRGLIIDGVNDDGRPLTFAEFYAEAPPELVMWTVRAVMSTTELSQAEAKNF